MRIRRRLLFLLAAALGAAVAVLPAVAGSETAPTIVAENFGGGIYGEGHAWSPAQVTVAAGGVVTLSNPTEVKHGVHWVHGPATPSCSGGVPVGATAESAAAKWSGACTFTVSGSYTFYCTVHGAAMQGTITVSPSGTTTTTTTTQPSSGSGGLTATTPTTSGQSGSEPTLGSAGLLGSPLAGSASTALRLPSSQHGKSVRGSIAVSPAGAGGRLEVDLLARSASLASSRHQAQVHVGRIVRTSLKAGSAFFSVPLNARATTTLLHRGRLALSVEVVLKPTSGSAVTLRRSVVVHR